MNIITIANKLDKSCDFYFKHRMHAVEWKLNALINKGKILKNKWNSNWKNPLIRKLEIYRV